MAYKALRREDPFLYLFVHNSVHKSSKVDVGFFWFVRSSRSRRYPTLYTLHFCSKSLACKFLVMDGSRTTMPSRSLLIGTWHPKRDVSCNPKARSSMSFSSSDGSSIWSNFSGSSIITWHVEQAQEPPQAPNPRQFHRHLSSRKGIRTFHLQVVGLGNVQQIIPLRYLKAKLLAIFVHEGHIDPVLLAPGPNAFHIRARITHSSPGFGGVRCPCCALAVAENDRTVDNPGLPSLHAIIFRLNVEYWALLPGTVRRTGRCGLAIESYKNCRDWPRAPRGVTTPLEN